MNRRLNKVLVIPGTTIVRGWPDEVLLEASILKQPTVLCCREVAPISIVDLETRAGMVSNMWLAAVCETLAAVFDCQM